MDQLVHWEQTHENERGILFQYDVIKILHDSGIPINILKKTLTRCINFL